MTQLERHVESTNQLLTEIRDLISAGQQRVQPQMTSWAFLVNQSGFNLVQPGIPGQRIFVESFVIVASGAVTATWGMTQGGSGTTVGTFSPISGESSVSGNYPGAFALATNGGVSYQKRYPSFAFYTENGQGVALYLSAGVQVGGILTYWVA